MNGMTENTTTEQPTDDAGKAVLTRQLATIRLADGDVIEVEFGNPDSIRWEQTAARRWPELLPDTDAQGNLRFKAPMFMQTFVAWAALKRCRLYDAEFEQFSERDCLEISVDETPVHPTPPAPSAG